MRAERTAEMLRAEGITATVKEIIKDGEHRKALLIGDEEVKPTIYPDKMSNYTDEEIVEEVKKMLKESEATIYAIREQLKNSLNKKNFYNNLLLFIAPAEETEEGTIEKDFLDLKLRMKIQLDLPNGQGFTTVNQKIIDAFEIDVDAAWMKAESNTLRNVKLLSLEDLRKGARATGYFWGEIKEDIPFFVLTTEYRSAAGIIDKEAIRCFAEGFDLDKVHIVPSSREEVLLFAPDMDVKIMNEIVRHTNRNMLAPEQVLSDHVYVYDYATNEITW